MKKGKWRMESGTCRKMKDSGIEWLGEVPEGWNLIPARNLFIEVKDKNVSGSETRQFSFRYGQIVDKEKSGRSDVTTEETITAYRIVTPDTIMINGLNLNYDFISQRVAIVKERGIITSAYLAVFPRKKLIDPAFAVYLFKGYDSKQVFHGHGSGIRKTLNFSDFKDIVTVCPPLPEQRKIAIFLDRACAKIDEIVAGTKQTIEEYKAWKASLIQEEMLKKHSFLQPLKSVVSYNDETLEDETDRDYEFDYVDIGAVKYGSGIVSRERMHFAESPSRARRIVKPGDVIVSTVRTYLRSVSIIPKFRVPLIVSTGFIVLRAKNIDSGYLQYAILSEGFISQVEANSVGISYPAINASQIVAFKIPVPRVDTQRRIADYLDKKCAAIDRVIAEKEALIADLEAYRKSLIFEVVTGKRSVGGM